MCTAFAFEGCAHNNASAAMQQPCRTVLGQSTILGFGTKPDLGSQSFCRQSFESVPNSCGPRAEALESRPVWGCKGDDARGGDHAFGGRQGSTGDRLLSLCIPRCIPLVPLYFASSPVKDTTPEKAVRSGLGFACRGGTFSVRSSLTGFRRSVEEKAQHKNFGRSSWPCR